MTRLLLTAVATGAALVAAPAHAYVAPACATSLVNAAAGATSKCSTDNTPQVSGATVVRTITVEVLAGVAKGTVSCGFGAYTRSESITVSGPQPRQTLVLENSPSCRIELAAVYPNTTAVATSTFSYAFINPGA